MELFLTHPDYPAKIVNVIDIAIIKNKINPKYFELQLILYLGVDQVYRLCSSVGNLQMNNLTLVHRAP